MTAQGTTPTPGPWSVHGPYAANHGREWEVSSLDGHGIWTARCQSEANARLIAAAPELLEALERVIYIRDNLNGAAAAQAWDKLDGEARAAIARAKGNGS
jgi:hypothetical protein